jgi:hypothetical protein
VVDVVAPGRSRGGAEVADDGAVAAVLAASAVVVAVLPAAGGAGPGRGQPGRLLLVATSPQSAGRVAAASLDQDLTVTLR